jgi:hypothetical protein
MHAELARFVARGRDHAAFARSADRDRPPAQLRIITLFDRCVERILGTGGGRPPPVTRSKAEWLRYSTVTSDSWFKLREN